MKPSEIEVGRCYANKSETRRKRVMSITRVCSFPVTVKIASENDSISTETIYDFARWADHEVKEPEVK